MRHLDELDDLGCRYCFLYTITGYPQPIDCGSPPPEQSIKTLQELSERVGAQKIAWRYDPIVLSSLSGTGFHVSNFRRIAKELKGAVHRCIISFVQPYRKARARMEAAAPGGCGPVDFKNPDVQGLLSAISESARENRMGIFSCASEQDLSGFGIRPSRCIDADLLSQLFGIEINAPKDPFQRTLCGCAAGRDIGVYDTCLFGCSYCYATSGLERAKANYSRHDPQSACLLG
jgi:hypothetical protein